MKKLIFALTIALAFTLITSFMSAAFVETYQSMRSEIPANPPVFVKVLAKIGYPAHKLLAKICPSKLYQYTHAARNLKIYMEIKFSSNELILTELNSMSFTDQWFLALWYTKLDSQVENVRRALAAQSEEIDKGGDAGLMKSILIKTVNTLGRKIENTEDTIKLAILSDYNEEFQIGLSLLTINF